MASERVVSVEWWVRNRHGDPVRGAEGCRDAEHAGWWVKFCNEQFPKGAPYAAIKRTITETDFTPPEDAPDGRD